MQPELADILHKLNNRLSLQKAAYNMLITALENHIPGLTEEVKQGILGMINHADPDNSELIDAICEFADSIESAND